ncbi:MAG: CRISPR-associated helicase Cas3' [Thermoplasmata archaeon]
MFGISMNPKSIFSEELITKLKNLYGKKDKDLYSHLVEVGKNSEFITKKIYISEEIINLINEESIKDMIILHSYLHDLGKMDKKFQQDKIHNPEMPSEIPHALFSLPLAYEIMDKKLKEFYNIDEKAKKILLSIAVLSIATHHSDYSSNLYLRFKDRFPEYDGISTPIKESPFNLFHDAYEYINGLQPLERWRYLYSLFNGVLRISDWFASGNIPVEKAFLKSSNEIQEGILNYINKNKWTLRDYQEYIKDNGFNIGYLALPTGDGKTETALLSNTENLNKVLYALPTVTTVESMRHRFEDYFGKENISFSHHLLFLSLFEEGQLDKKIFHEYNLNKIIVTTIDRILLSLMNCKHYPLLELSLNKSYLIVDEIHSYTPWTLSIILNSLEYIKKYHNTKILVMSATLPNLIKEELKNRINAVPIIPEEKMKERYSKKKRVDVIFRDNYLINKNGLEEYNSDYIEEIENLVIKEEKRVLIVLNTVDRAKAFYKLLSESSKDKNIGIYLIHSRFTQEDKRKKMDLIENLKKDNKPCILISTQVVEVSIDIDFDVLYTEIAPFDALIQRFGRINRSGRKVNCKAFVFKTEEFLPYDNSQIQITEEMLKNNNFDTEIDFLNTNNIYYEKMRKKYESEFQKNPLDDFITKIPSTEFGESMITRDNTFMTIPVIPVGYDNQIFDYVKKILENWKKFKEEEKVKATAEILKKVIELPLYSVKEIIFNDSDLSELFGLKFINAIYSSEIGIISNKRGAVIL